MGLFDFFSTLIETNPYFKAGAGLAGMGMVAAAGRKGLAQAMILSRRYLWVSLEVNSKDKSYQWLLNWLGEQGMRTQHVSVETSFQKLDTGKINTNFSLVPSPGRHIFMRKEHWFPIIVERMREKQALDMTSGVMWESVTLTTFGRDKRVFLSLLDEARKNALEKEDGKTVIFTSFGSEWRMFGHPRRRRPIGSVILDKQIADVIVDDVKNFNDSVQWYMDRGIPYRRGYLLHGPPGCGKSSFVAALAAELQYNICVLSLSESGLSDDRLNHLLTVAPQRSIILLEDIDAALPSRRTTQEEQQKQANYAALPNTVTFSGLLNALDGVASGEERILFMTTNHPEKLDPALTRPGRVDVVQYIGQASRLQIERMFVKFFPDDAHRMTEFASQLPVDCISMAQLQGFFMQHRSTADEAIAAAKDWSANLPN